MHRENVQNPSQLRYSCPTLNLNFDLVKIAKSLSCIYRYHNEGDTRYSVAQHSVRVCQQCKPEHKLIGLLHDVPEAYLGDVISPIKDLLPDYQELEAMVWKDFVDWFHSPWLTVAIPEEVDIIDKGCQFTELSEESWSPAKAEQAFLETLDPWCEI